MRKWPELFGYKSMPSETEISGIIKSYPDGVIFLGDIIKNNRGKVHIYAEVNDSKPILPFFDQLAPSGMLFEVLRTSSNRAKLKNLEDNYHLWGKYQYRSPLSGIDMNDYAGREILSFYAEGHNFSGLIYVFAKEYDKAESEFVKALVIYPGYISATVNLKKLKKERTK